MSKTPQADIRGQAIALASHVAYAEQSIVSKTLIDKSVGTITLFAFDAGQGLSEHTAPYDAFVYVVEGTGTYTIGDKPIAVAAGQLIIMPARVPHSVHADERMKMLLVMIRA